MPKLTDTYALAYACCDRVLQETERFPTIDSIRERIGVNSPTTIKKAINDWTEAFARKHFEQLHRPELPALLIDATESLWQLALKQAELSFAAQTKQHHDELGQLQQQLQAAEDKILAISTELSETRQQRQQVVQENQALQQDLDQRRSAEAAFIRQCDDQAHEITQLKQVQVAALQQFEAQQAQDQLWYQRRIVEERDVQAQQWQAKHLQSEERLQGVQLSLQQALQNAQQARENHLALQRHCKQLEAALAGAQKAKPGPAWRRKRQPLR